MAKKAVLKARKTGNRVPRKTAKKTAEPVVTPILDPDEIMPDAKKRMTGIMTSLHHEMNYRQQAIMNDLPELGTEVEVKGKTFRVVGYNSKVAKPIVLEEVAPVKTLKMTVADLKELVSA